jgi:DNA-binding transcriptional regulator YiaG
MTPREILEIRIKMNLTQQKFAMLIGVAHSTLCSWETGRRSPSQMAIKILKDQREKICL